MQHLLQILAGHPVVQVSHMDFCPIRERLWAALWTRATGGSQKRGGPAGHAGGCAPWFGQKKDRRRNFKTWGHYITSMSHSNEVQSERNETGLNPASYRDDQDGTGGLKLRLKFSLLKADGMLAWNSTELPSFCSKSDSATPWGLASSLLKEKMLIKRVLKM